MPLKDKIRNVSVILSVYNENPIFLRKAIDSILKQTYSDFEFLIIDDGSDKTDTITTLKEYATKDRRISIFKQENQGLTKSLNTGISKALGAVIFRQDSDDWSEHNRLELQLNLLETNEDIGLIGSQAILHQENGNELWKTQLPNTTHEIKNYLKNHGNPFIHGSVCFRKELAEKINGYREDFKYGQDYDFFYRLSEICECININQSLYHYRFTYAAAPKATGYELTTKTTRVLATEREEKGTDTFEQALDLAKQNAQSSYTSQLALADRLMLAGYYLISGKKYLNLVLKYPLKLNPWLKLCRYMVFLALPQLRVLLFNKKNN
ncbi:MAG: glycosyltransferase [Bdellovibrionales bacterium]|nr:glycosyltransferase [Bdellovibrionales bacterium]